MAKAINWPFVFRSEILAEGCKQERIALRLGQLYYEHQYWVPDEVVDIRVEHKKIRQARIVGALRQCAVQSLSPADFGRLKQPLRNPQAVMDFLSTTYNQPVDGDTLVTVVTYKNHPVVPEEIEA